MSNEKNGKKNGKSNGHLNGQINGHAHEPSHEVVRATDDLADVALPSSAYDDQGSSISVSKSLHGKRILVTGATGFLAKVYISMLLRYHPDIEQLYVLIRESKTKSANDRFLDEVISSPVFDPLREIYGAGFDEFLREKVTPLGGDITQLHMGLAEDEARTISSVLDVFVNSAGLTNFNPNLESALRINTMSSQYILDFIKLGGSHAKLLHVSTAFVAGSTQKPTPEVLPLEDVYPRQNELGVDFDAIREIKDCLAMIEHAKVLSKDQERHTTFVKAAKDKLKKENRLIDEQSVEKEIENERRDWIKRHLSTEGRKRAEHWGWVNIYTYTKSLGERLLVEHADDVEYSIFRPAIIESSMSYPFPGWNEGMNTTAPIMFLIYKGHRFIPAKPDVKLDVIPVDWVTGLMIGMTAALIESRHEAVYHCGTSDRNPMTLPRIVELCALASRQIHSKKVGVPAWKKLVINSMDAITVDEGTFKRQSIPGMHKAAKSFGSAIDKLPTRQMGAFGKALSSVRNEAKKVEKLTATGEKIFELFMPFIHDNKYVFVAQNSLKLSEMLHPSERHLYGCPVESLDWRHYWLNVHTPGLEKWVFPNLEEKLKGDPRETYTYKDLVELFDSSTTNYAQNIALQHHRGGEIVERYTYGELKERAERVASFLNSMGISTGSSVLLLGENRPQWGMVYFGILKAGAIAVPVDAESTPNQVINLAKSCRAHAIVLSQEVFDRMAAEIESEIASLGLPTRILTHNQLLTLQLPGPDVKIPDDAPKTTDDPNLASLIFTSGTTGDPKGVMLSHQNFTSLLSSLDGTFRITDRDGFLSVLPLHHTFEFSAGFLMPLSKGASVTYLDELSGEELKSAMNATRVTALIGVPALWQLLHRSIKQRVDAAGPSAKVVFDNMIALNQNLRKRGVNVGPLLFSSVHKAFGNHIKYLISGGASLPEDVLEAFNALGFDIYEGYGLTEAAPVLTVSRPQDGLKPGSVGKSIPHVEIKIHNPDENGVGEVVARGPNVMLGYLDREDDTKSTLQDGWLHTGDLGTLDDKGRLTIVGRRKEVIVTSGGKNVYPDELEDIYGKAPGVLELAIVGLPDGRGSERVACLVRPDVPDGASAEEIAELRKSIREWIRVEGLRGTPHTRIQVLRFWDEVFPRTSTRKVKRREILEILDRLLVAEETGVDKGESDHAWVWLEKAVATLAGKDASAIHHNTHLVDDLGFDSLMFVELVSILEAHSIYITAEALSRHETLGALREALENSSQSAQTALVVQPKSTAERVESLPVPAPVSELGKKALHEAQMRSYKGYFDVQVSGKANIPWHSPNVIVIANHSSHLDMGLVKFALGDFGKEIRALAAADYFFSNKIRKTYFQNFTNLIPVERAGTPDVALKGALDALDKGETLLMFPEGTRASDGKLRKFRRGLGFLVATQKVDILPVWIEGTHRALPKGKSLPSLTSRKLKVRIGKPLEASKLVQASKGATGNDLWDFIAESAYQSMVDLRDLGVKKTGGEDILQPLFSELNQKFERDQLDQPVTYYFTLGASDDQKWSIVVNANDCSIYQGKPKNGAADCVVKTSPEIFRKIVQEKYVPSFDEFMNGTIKTNSPDLLARFGAVFKLQG